MVREEAPWYDMRLASVPYRGNDVWSAKNDLPVSRLSNSELSGGASNTTRAVRSNSELCGTFVPLADNANP